MCKLDYFTFISTNCSYNINLAFPTTVRSFFLLLVLTYSNIFEVLLYQGSPSLIFLVQALFFQMTLYFHKILRFFPQVLPSGFPVTTLQGTRVLFDDTNLLPITDDLLFAQSLSKIFKITNITFLFKLHSFIIREQQRKGRRKRDVILIQLKYI